MKSIITVIIACVLHIEGNSPNVQLDLERGGLTIGVFHFITNTAPIEECGWKFIPGQFMGPPRSNKQPAAGTSPEDD